LRTTPFDELAEDYDRSFTHSACGRSLRARVWERAAKLFAGRERILDLGCGTGEDAVHLARAGHRVVAVDASPEMIRIARLKAAAAGVGDRIEFHVMTLEAVHALPRDEPLDGVFSNFGVINCVADPRRLAGTLAGRLARRAPLLFVVMGRYVPWEWAWYLAHGDRARAFRRLRADGVEWRGMHIRYPTPRTLQREVAPYFDVTRRSAVGFALPPSYAAEWLNGAPRMLATLEGIERLTHRFTASLGDHFMLEAERREAS